MTNYIIIAGCAAVWCLAHWLELRLKIRRLEELDLEERQENRGYWLAVHTREVGMYVRYGQYHFGAPPDGCKPTDWAAEAPLG